MSLVRNSQPTSRARLTRHDLSRKPASTAIIRWPKKKNNHRRGAGGTGIVQDQIEAPGHFQKYILGFFGIA